MVAAVRLEDNAPGLRVILRFPAAPTADPSEECGALGNGASNAGMDRHAGAHAFIERMSEAPQRLATALAPISALEPRRALGDAESGAAAQLPRRAARYRAASPASSAARRYLAGLIERDPARLQRILTTAPEMRLAELNAELARPSCRPRGRAPTAMRALARVQDRGGAADGARRSRRRVAGDDRHRALTECADAALTRRRRFPLSRGGGARAVAGRAATVAVPGAGYIVLAMGKYGAGELNYSSDIDLIVFFDRDRIASRAGRGAGGLLRAPDARSRAADAGAHRRRLRLPHRPAPAPRPRRHASSRSRPTPRSTTTRASARTGSAPP